MVKWRLLINHVRGKELAIRKSLLLTLMLACLSASAPPMAGQSISAQGQTLAVMLDGTGVEELWLAGHERRSRPILPSTARVPLTRQTSCGRLYRGDRAAPSFMNREIITPVSARERKREEEAFRESEATLQAILAASPVGITLIHGRTVAWTNKAKYDMLGYAMGSLQQTRSLTSELIPPVLYELGLVPALESLTEQTERRYGPRSQFMGDNRPKPISDDLAELLFRAVQQLLVNVVKHAQTQEARVAVVTEGEYVRIRVEDKGIGFDASKIESQEDRARRFGLFSIRERLHHLGGSVAILSEAGRGTQVSLTAPLRQNKNRRR